MQAYKGYFRAGRFIPENDVTMLDNAPVIVTILDESPEDVSRRQREAMARFLETVQNEPTPEFERVKFTREVEL
jgi:hypothetical protein